MCVLPMERFYTEIKRKAARQSFSINAMAQQTGAREKKIKKSC